ncbi:MAG: S8 family serine peptidase [Bacteroidales bacterium]|nr:S8 family serine peptidase [Bacteroidales bacterium]
MIKNYITIFLISFILLFAKEIQAQKAYWVFFTDKKDVQFNPYEYFDQKAIDRRIINGIPLNMPTDWPLNTSYVKQVKSIADSVSGQTRWFNALAVRGTDIQIEKIKRLSFVRKVQEMGYYAIPASTKARFDVEYSNLRNRQLDILGRSEFKANNYNGKGVRIAIFDGGFPGVDTNPAFAQIRKENRLVKTWDFTKNKEFVFYSISHGTMVMSNIGGMVIINNDTAQYGLATAAEFMLAKTEVIREPFSEEKNWLMAVEWADKNGADIINSSLGYTKDRYFRVDMDGNTSLVSQAANMAAKKGILVVNAAGNDGDSKWHIMGAPADADSVLSVGGINPNSEYHISFSSYGPTSDGRMKPNICAFGNTMVFFEGEEHNVNGTSFASPLIAGFAACALQANPGIKNMDLFHLIEQSGHLYPYFDYAHGYGVPQASYVINKKRALYEATFTATIENNIIHIKILNNENNQVGSSQLLYFNIQNIDGALLNYRVIKVNSLEFDIDLRYGDEDANRNKINAYLYGYDKINIYFKGYTQQIKI